MDDENKNGKHVKIRRARRKLIKLEPTKWVGEADSKDAFQNERLPIFNVEQVTGRDTER